MLSVLGSLIAFWLVWENANNEPYVYFRYYDALTQLGLGAVMLGWWLYLIGAVIYGLHKKRLNPAWMMILPWALVVLFYLRCCPQGFLEDRTHYSTESQTH